MDEVDHQASGEQLHMYEGGGKNKNRGAASERNGGNFNQFARDDSDQYKKSDPINEERNKKMINRGKHGSEIELSQNSGSEWNLEPSGRTKDHRAKTT